MNRKLTVALLAVILLIAAFAFAENGGLLPAASVAAGQPASAAALPEPPAAQPMPQPIEKPLGFTYGFDERFAATLITMPVPTAKRMMKTVLYV